MPEEIIIKLTSLIRTNLHHLQLTLLIRIYVHKTKKSVTSKTTLKSLQGHFCGIQFLIDLGPRYEILSLLWYTDLVPTVP